jgi:hypothetical protein
LVVVFGGGNRLQVFGLKYLVAVQTADIVYAISSRQDLGTSMVAGLHK